MEPVPEMEKLEEFSSMRIQVAGLEEAVHFTTQPPIKKPPTIRRSTEPTPQSPLSPIVSSPFSFRPRATSPYSVGHLRSKSSSSPLAPPMHRAQSMPGYNTAGHIMSSPLQRASSPKGSPIRIRTPRKPADEIFPGLPNRALRDTSESGDALRPGLANRTLRDISESGGIVLEEETTPRAPVRSSSPILSLPASGNFARSRRPASPLRYLSQQSVGSTAPSTPSSVNSSPSYQAARFNDAFLGSSGYSGSLSYPGSFASSSVPSTPTSTRSRSPSISSLETIPDSPDAEEAALEVERVAHLQAAADTADGSEDSKAKVDTSAPRGRSLSAGFGRDKRKRWSVCGAERRGDLNLDTIWED